MKTFNYSIDDFSNYQKLRDMPIVYVLTTSDFKYTKIGIAKNIKQRMSNVQSGCPFHLTLYLGAHAPNTRDIENTCISTSRIKILAVSGFVSMLVKLTGCLISFLN